MGWYKEYPRDKNNHILRVGDFVIVDYIWDDGKHHERMAGNIISFDCARQRRWQWTITVKFFGEDKLWDCRATNCEWITKRRRQREQKLLMLKLENS